MARIAIVGASLAGTHAAQVLRRRDPDGEVVLIGDEPHYPYDRPPLSKEFLTNDALDEDRLRLRPAADPEALGVEWRLGERAAALRPPKGDEPAVVRLEGGAEISADGVIIATGARPRTLPAAEGLAGVHLLRGIDDARSLSTAFRAEPERVVVIGCGFIGAEVAASARQRGLDVTIIEAAAAPLTRVLDEASGRAVADLHTAHGVDVRLATGVAGFSDRDGRVEAVELDDGSSVAADVVVIGIGVVPNDEWLADSGLVVDDGVVTDSTCLAGPGVVAVGDVARWPNPRFGERRQRIEQWDNAVMMGSYGAERLLAWLHGETIDPFQPVPWFWSDQYDRKIQLAGTTAPNVEIVQGTVAEQRYVQLYLTDDEQVRGALCWNRPRQAIMARQLIERGAELDEMREALA